MSWPDVTNILVLPGKLENKNPEHVHAARDIVERAVIAALADIEKYAPQEFHADATSRPGQETSLDSGR